MRGQKVGFVTNQTAVTYDSIPAVDALLHAKVNIISLFTPEHGIRGEALNGEKVASSTDSRTGLPIHSLYGQTKKPTPKMLQDLDLLLFDIQDAGARFYTFLSTMAYLMQACAENRKPFILLDRPNPLGGTAVEGPMLDNRFSSFVGLYPIPIRYGMTIGELALYINSEFGIDADLKVINMRGWRRNMWFDETGLAWIPPSPAMPTLDTAIVYPGTCLLEGTNLSEGRGTTSPFEFAGAPWVDGPAFSEALNHAKLPGVYFDIAEFTPTHSKYAGEICSGVRVRVADRERFLPVLTGIKITELAHRLWPGEMSFCEAVEDGRSFFDLLAGTDRIRLQILNGKTAEGIADGWSEEIQRFKINAARNFLYE